MMPAKSEGLARPYGHNRSGKSSMRTTQESRQEEKRRREELPNEEVTARMARQEADFQDNVSVRVLFSKLARRQMSAAQVGVRLNCLLRRCQGLWAEGAKGLSATGLGGEGSSSERLSPDLLPLPVPRFEHLSDEEIDKVFPHGLHDQKGQFRFGTQAWTTLAIQSLNLVHSNGQCSQGPVSGSEAQRKAVQLIYEECAEFCRPSKGLTSGNPEKALGAKLESYRGDFVATAEELSLEQVIPTLPEPGVAGSVPIVKVIDGQLRDQIRDPPSVMLPKEEWPEFPPSATTMCPSFVRPCDGLWSKRQAKPGGPKIKEVAGSVAARYV